MAVTEKNVECPNGYRVLQIGELVPEGIVLRRSKYGEDEWHQYDWPRKNLSVNTTFSNFYAVPANEPRKEW